MNAWREKFSFLSIYLFFLSLLSRSYRSRSRFAPFLSIQISDADTWQLSVHSVRRSPSGPMLDL